MLKTFEEYRYFRVKSDRDNDWNIEWNVKDKNEPFFNKEKGKYKEHKHLKWIFSDENRVKDYLEIKNKLKKKGIEIEKDPVSSDEGSTSCDINKYILVSFNLYDNSVNIIYSPLGSNRLAMREISRISKKDKRFDVNKIVNDISNFIEKKKIFDKEMEDGDKFHKIDIDSDPFGEEVWNNKRNQVEQEIRKEKDFWEWMDDQNG